MDLFRRIFGKTGEELPAEDAVEPEDAAPQQASQESDRIGDTVDLTPVADPAEKPSDQQADPAIDASTRPVTKEGAAKSLAEGVTQPLNSEAVVTMNNRHLTFGQSTDVGLVRNNNQDAVMSFLATSGTANDYPDFGVFVVADGMGGHQLGEKASAITASTLISHIVKTVYVPMLAGNGTADMPPITEAMIESVQSANMQVIDQVVDGGTTVTAIVVVGDLAYVAHVGDSRAYLITQNGVEQITRDHSLVQRLIELDQLTPEEAENHNQKNVLYRALGQNETLEVDTLSRRLPANSRLLICSDGLWNQVSEKDMFEMVMNFSDPQQVCDKLVALANTHGGIDNISVILLKVS